MCERCSKRDWRCIYDFDQDISKVGSDAQGNVLALSLQESEDSFEPLPYPSRDFAASTSLPPARLSYCARLLLNCVREVVTEVETSFIKRKSAYKERPEPFKDAYCACAVYTCRTDSNDMIVQEVVLETYARLMLTPPTQNLTNDMAGLQAVLLLHILLLFDGDIRFRSKAESQMDMIRDKVLRLQRLAGSESVDGQELASYDRWILMESVRRTIMMATLVECIYMNLKDGFTNTASFLAMLPITVSGALWRARSESEWRFVSTRVPMTILPYGEALKFWTEEAARDQLDGLQKLLVVSCKGDLK